MLRAFINGVAIRARTERVLFRKVAHAMGGTDAFSRLDCWNGNERVFEITAATWIRSANCWEVQRREFVTVEGKE